MRFLKTWSRKLLEPFSVHDWQLHSKRDLMAILSAGIICLCTTALIASASKLPQKYEAGFYNHSAILGSELELYPTEDDISRPYCEVNLPGVSEFILERFVSERFCVEIGGIYIEPQTS